MEGTIYSLIPALLMLVLVLLTRKVLLSLGAGVLVGAFLLHDFKILGTIVEIWFSFLNIFYTIDGLNLGNLYLFAFLILLGITTAFMTASGSSRAFGDWIITKVKTRRMAKLIAPIMGLIIFVDDYFNSLAVGQVARPVTDRHNISRTKLAYFIDSTSAPITVISPISSWGANIIVTIGMVFAAENITEYQPLEAFVKMIPFNMYAFAAITLVFFTAIFDLNIGPMKKHENRAITKGEVFDIEKGDIPGDLGETVDQHQDGKVLHLLLPIITLIVGTGVAMIVSGINNTEGTITVFTIFENTNVNISLFIGGLVAVIIAWLLYIRQSKPKTKVLKVFIEGTKAMLPAVYILIFAWMIGSIIENLQTGEFLAKVVEQANLSIAFIPLLLFIVAGFMALATGTSWGTFGIMLPIAGGIAAVTDINLILPALSAVLAGSVFGDHCSPISDTSILSSTGAGSNHIDHVVTQLPYALIGALASVLGYLFYGFTSLLVPSLLITIVSVILIGWITKYFSKDKIC